MYNNYANVYGLNGMNSPYNYNTPMYNPTPTPMPMQTNQQPNNTNKIYVSGEEEVRTKGLPAGSDYIFLDNDKPLLYQKIVSPSGQFEVKTFSIVPYEPKKEEKEEKTMDLSGYVKTTDLDPIKKEIQYIKDRMIMKKADSEDGTK